MNEYKNIIWHSHTESPNRTSQILIRIDRGDKYEYHIWKFIEDEHESYEPSSSFYITHDRLNGIKNVCLPGVGPNAYFEYHGDCSTGMTKVFVDYQWAYLE